MKYPSLGELLLLCCSAAASWAALELLTVVGISSGIISTALVPTQSFYNRPCMEFDAIRGFKWSAGTNCRTLRLHGNDVIFDQKFTPNNMGYISRQDYTYKKSKPETFRLVIFGDSFTSGHFLEMPWPDRLQRLLNSTAPPGRRYEVYSFAVNGGGLANWHSIFFNNLVGNFDFDAVVIASLADNLSRDFSIFHGTAQGIYFGRFPTAPRSREEFLLHFLPKMRRLYEVAVDEELDVLVRKREQAHLVPFEAYATRFLVNRIRDGGRRFVSNNQPEQSERTLHDLTESPRFSMATLEKRYGSRKLSKLTAILDYCRQKSIPVFLASVPSRVGLLKLKETKHAKRTVHQVELASIAEMHSAAYFDGYELFKGIGEKEIVGVHWLKYDGHWALPGSDLFARGFSEYIQNYFANPTLAAARPSA